MASSMLQKTPQLECVELGAGRRVVLLDVVGRGGAAVVHRAQLCSGSGLTRPVAVKVFSAVSSDEVEQVRVLVTRTACRMAWVDHPNVVRVYEVGDQRGHPLVIEELVSGVSLAALHEHAFVSKQRRMPLDLALFVAAEVAEGLAAARLARDGDGVQLGIVHHALSAKEVLLSWRGEVKVSDFEASTARAATSSVRTLRGMASRAATMAPEVAQGCPGDARSDVFSFGVLLRELLIGPRFPTGLTSGEAVRLAREGYVQPFTFQPHLPPGLEAVMQRALAVDPDARYPNACAMAFDLRRVVLSMGVGDGRYFLRKALEREWSQATEEITAQTSLPRVPETGRRSEVDVVALDYRDSRDSRANRRR